MDLGLLRRLGLLLGVVCCFVTVWSSPTLVPPGNVSGVWIQASSPYIIKHGNITVPNGSSLYILAGVEVIFEGHHKFIVNGHLRAAGNAADSVVIKGLHDGGLIGWKGLRLVGADSTQFDYCVFENGNAILGDASDSTGGVAFISGSGSRVVFNHCTFRNNYAGSNGGALFVSGGTSAECYDCDFVGNETAKDGGAAFVNNSTGSRFERCEFFLNRSGKEAGAIHSRFGTPVYLDCHFHHNTSFNSGGAVMASGQASLRRCVFERNTSENSQGGGLYFYDYRTTATVDSCLIRENRTLLRDGGGAYCWEAAPRFTDCQFWDNVSADDGGGVHCYRRGANPEFTRCLFEGNRAADTGGGIIISNESLPVLTDCEFRNNSSNIGGGGGVYIRLQSQPIFTNCVIENNTSTGSGGGVGTLDSVPFFIRCLIRNNRCDSLGGGIAALATEITLTDCDISNNEAGMNGGGLAVTLATPAITRSRIQNNTADSLGGGVYAVEALPTFTNCLIAGNIAGVRAGAGYFNVSSPTFAHCTIADNTSALGNVFVIVDSPGRIVNSIVATSENELGNGAPPRGIGIVGGSVAWEIRNTLFHRIGAAPFAGSFAPGFAVITTTDHNGTARDGYGNLFESPGFIGTGSEPYLLADGDAHSVAVNTAAPLGIVNDLADGTRPLPLGSLPDLGCFEAAQSGDAAVMAGALTGIIPAGQYRVFGDIVVPLNTMLTIEPGANFEFMGPYAVLVHGKLKIDGNSSDSVRMFADTSGNLLGWRGIRFQGEQASGSVLSYLTLSNATAWAIDSSGGALGFFGGASPCLSNCAIRNCGAASGGGARVVSGGPTFASCVFEHCSANEGGALRVESGAAVTLNSCAIEFCSSVSGGGISSEQSELTLINTHCESNSALDGGVMYLRNSSLSLSYLSLVANSASNFGGAIYASNTTLNGDSLHAQGNTASRGGVFYFVNGSGGEIVNLLCKDNSATTSGGVMHSQNGRLRLANGLFSSNSAAQNGGAFSLVSDTSRVIRGTLVRNSALNGAAVYLENARATITSCQITDNGAAVYFRSSASARIEFSNFTRNGTNFRYYLNSTGHGPASIGVINNANYLEYPSDSYFNIFVNPLYVDFENGDFALSEASNCMDAGNPSVGCDDDLTFPEIGAFHTAHTDNPWVPDELSVLYAEPDSVQLSWKRPKAARLCNPSELTFVIEAQDLLGAWQQVYATTDTACVIPLPDSAAVVPLRVRSSVEP